MKIDKGNGKLTPHSENMAALRKFAGGAAHDMNNVLTSILGFGTMIQDMVEDPEIQADMKELLEAAGRGVTICERFANLARFGDIQKMPCQLEPLVMSSELELMQLLGPAVEVKWELAENPSTINMDPQQILGVAKIIASNAHDAMPRGGRFTIGSKVSSLAEGNELGLAAGEYVSMQFTDSGTGIDRQLLERAHLPFVSSRSDDKFAGLGLANALDAASVHGGTLEITPLADGTQVTIWLPLVKEETNSTNGDAPRLSEDRGNILIVDPETMVCKLAERILGGLNYTVAIANTPIEALNQCRQAAPPYDLAIMDINFNDEDMEMAMREHAPELRVIYMSNMVNGMHQPRVLAKPFRREDLVSQVERALA